MGDMSVNWTSVVGVAAAAVGGWLLHLGTRDASLVSWECAVSTCGTNDFAGAAPILGVLALALAGTLLIRPWRTAAAPAMVLLGSVSALLGWRSAIDQRLIPAQSVRVWLVITGIIAAVALVLTVLTAVRELRRSAGWWVLLGRQATWGRVTDYRNGDGRCTGTVHFEDAAGTRYQVHTTVPREAFARPPRVYYDPVSPTDPSRLRIGMPGQPLSAAARRAQIAAVRELLPLPGDATAERTRTTHSTHSTRTTHTSRSSTETITDVTVALERLAALHASGALSDDEFDTAKAAVLRR